MAWLKPVNKYQDSLLIDSFPGLDLTVTFVGWRTSDLYVNCWLYLWNPTSWICKILNTVLQLCKWLQRRVSWWVKVMMIIHADELNGVFTCGGISVWELPLFCQAAISAVLSSFAWLCLGYLKPWWKYRWLGGSQTGWGHSWASQWQSRADQYSQDCITEWLWGYLFSEWKTMLKELLAN